MTSRGGSPYGGRKIDRVTTQNSRGATWVVVGVGILVALLGVYGMIRPNVVLPAKRQTLQIRGQQVLMETRRVVDVPRPLSGLIIFCGAGLIFMGFTKA
jgi:hypothetical protein